MRSTLARFLLVALTTTSCSSKTQSTADHAAREELTSFNSSTTADMPPSPEEAGPDDGRAEAGGVGTAIAIDEGKLGKRDSDGRYKLAGTSDLSGGFDDPNVYGGSARQQALEAARSTGVLGSTGTGIGGGGVGRGGMRGRMANVDRAEPTSGEGFREYTANAWSDAAKDHLSTFAADVDTASYTIGRRKLVEQTLPPPASVRVEEYVNYFRYGYPAPAAGTPFSVTMDMAASPFDGRRQILRVGVSTKQLSIRERKPANLVFLVDVSGSMASPDKLDLAKRSLRILVDSLTDQDTVSLVTYAGSTRVVLAPTGLDHKREIESAIEDLASGGGTAMGAGIELAYAQAVKGLRPGAISRVIVLSDGDANIGTTGHDAILKLIAGKVKEGVTLSTIGFGMGNYKDEQMEQLANKGNGNNFYIDGLSAAKRVFQEQLGSTLEVVAKDVKLQVDFEPSRVARYRLIGYENRDVADRDFRDDRIDAGEIGAGHQVTALYEVELASNGDTTKPLATVRVRHKQPTATTATEAAFPMSPSATSPMFAQASQDLRFAFAVAAFADVMRGGADAKAWNLGVIRTLAEAAAGSDPDRKELVQLIDRAITLRKKTS